MGKVSIISWTDATFNGWIGCHEVSPACDECYARTLAERYGWAKWGKDTPRHRTSAAYWRGPVKWNAEAAAKGKRLRVFAFSLADVFEDRRDLDPWRADLYKLIEATPNLDWMLLSKRADAIARLLPQAWLDKPRPNVWLGVTAENQRRADERVPVLLRVPAVVHWVSAEPLLGPLDLRQWLGYYPVHETDDARRGSLQGGAAGGAADRPEGQDLARKGEAGGQMEGRKPTRALPPPPGGERHRGISPGTGDVQGSALARPGAPASLEARQRPDTAGSYCQPLQRQEERQQATESGVENLLRPDEAHDRRAQEGSGATAVRRAERDGEADRSDRSGDSAASESRGAIKGDSAGLSSIGSNRLEDRAGREMGISWVIVGGESGAKPRRMDPAWVNDILDQCRRGGAAYHFKQKGNVLAAEMGCKDKAGKDPSEWPAEFRVQEFPSPQVA